VKRGHAQIRKERPRGERVRRRSPRRPAVLGLGNGLVSLTKRLLGKKLLLTHVFKGVSKHARNIEINKKRGLKRERVIREM